MIIRCYGARGSIPVSGEDFNRYGGDTTCLEIRSKNDKVIIVDAGSGIRRLGNKLAQEQEYDINFLFTHSHLDHLMGFPFFKPVYDEKTKINLMGCPNAQGNVKLLLSKAMSPPLFPVQFGELKAKINYSADCALSYKVDSIEIFPINLSHPNLGMGYKFVEDGKTFVFLTDNELAYKHRGGKSFDEYVAFSRDADFLIHDAQYTPKEYEETKTWGHSTYVDAVNMALSAEAKCLGLFHHDPDRNDVELDAVVEKCKSEIKKNKMQMECFAVTQTAEIVL